MNETNDTSATTIEEQLRRKIVILEDNIVNWGIAEFMVRNPNVNSFVKEMEKRIVKAESRIQEREDTGKISKQNNQLEIRELFHTLWTKAVTNLKDYDKKEWQKLADLLRHHNIEVQ